MSNRILGSPPLKIFFLVLFVAGCASAKVVERSSVSAGQYVAKPGRIIVYDINATPSDIPPTAAITGHYARRNIPQTPAQIQAGRKLGAIVSGALVREILRLGMPAERAGGAPANVGDIVISGVFVVFDEGSRTDRMLIGFGEGGGSLQTLVEGYQVTPAGLHPLGSARIGASSGKTPGVFLPLVVGAATGEMGRSLIIAGGLNVVQELGPRKMSSLGKNTAKKIAKVLRDVFRRRGWI
jgi:hypothetical protein